MNHRIAYPELIALLDAILQCAGASPAVARCLAMNCAACERDGSRSHGVFRIPGYVSTLRSGWVDGRAVPSVEDVASGFVRVNARNGFAQPALEAAHSALLDKARMNGAAVLAIRDSHHFSALWPDVEPFAREGFVAISAVNSMAVTVPYGGRRPVFGTNPLAFAAPVAGGDPIVFDLATSAMAHGDVQIAARESRALPPGTGVDRDGEPTTDPRVLLEGGALLPFGGHKGSAVSLMVEVLGAALTGGNFSTEFDWSTHPGAQTPRTGQFLLVIDPRFGGGAPFGMRTATLVRRLREAGLSRLPAERRYRNRAAADLHGILVSTEELEDLEALVPS